MPLSLSQSGKQSANWFAGSIYTAVAFDIVAATIEPCTTFNPLWKYVAAWIVFIMIQGLWFIIAWRFASFRQMRWMVIVLLILVYAFPERAIEVVVTFHANPVWCFLRGGSLIAEAIATVFGVTIVLNVWSERRKAGGSNGMV